MKYPVSRLSIVVFFLLVAVNTPAAEPDSKFKPGEELLDAWRLTQAEEFAAKALKEDPKSAAALEFDGRVKFYQGRYPEALAELDRALAIDSSSQRRQALKLFTQLTVEQDFVSPDEKNRPLNSLDWHNGLRIFGHRQEI